MVRTYLHRIELLLRPVPLVGETDDGGSALADGHLLADAVFLQQADRARSGFRPPAPVRVGLLAASRRARGGPTTELGGSEKVFEGELLAASV